MPKQKAYAINLLERQQGILNLLRQHPQGLSIREIEGFMETWQSELPTIRTLQRNLQQLASKFPLVQESGRWRWCGNRRTETILPLPAEALMLSVAEKQLPVLLPWTAAQQLRQAAKGAEKSLQDSQADLARRWLGKIRSLGMGPQRISPEPESGCAETVYEALLNDEMLLLSYCRSGQSEQIEWRVHPLALVQKDGFVYLIVMRDEDQAIRNLALHRIRAARRLYLSAAHPIEWQGIDAYVESGELDFPPGFEVEKQQLILKIAHQTAQRFIDMPLPGQILLSSDQNYITVRAELRLSEETLRWLLQFGPMLEVLQPPAVRKRLTDLIREMSEMYCDQRRVEFCGN